MKTSSLFALAAASTAQMVAAHSTVWNLWVNDVDQGVGREAGGYIRSPPNNDPVKDVTSKDMTCNVGGAKAAGKTVSVAGGDKLTFEWHHDTNQASDDIIATSHYGPVMVYIAPTASNGEGDVWLKLAEDGYSNGKWAVTTLIANRGKHSITLPDLKAGEYLLRPEIIALHEGMNVGGAQFYMECVQIKVTSSGAVTLPAGVAIPGAYTAEDAGVHFDIYNGFTSYPIPGPKVWNGASGSGSTTPAKTSSKAAVSSAAATSKAAVSSVAAAASSVVKTSAAPAVTSKAAVTSSKAAVATSAAPVVTKATTLVTSVKKVTTTVIPGASTTSKAAGATTVPSTGTVEKYGQCGGSSYKGATKCAGGFTCKVWNEWYSQCVEA